MDILLVGEGRRNSDLRRSRPDVRSIWDDEEEANDCLKRPNGRRIAVLVFLTSQYCCGTNLVPSMHRTLVLKRRRNRKKVQSQRWFRSREGATPTGSVIGVRFSETLGDVIPRILRKRIRCIRNCRNQTKVTEGIIGESVLAETSEPPSVGGTTTPQNDFDVPTVISLWQSPECHMRAQISNQNRENYNDPITYVLTCTKQKSWQYMMTKWLNA